MRKVVVPTFLLTLLFLSQAIIYADPSEEAKRAQMRKKIEAKKLELNGTQWNVTVNPQGETKATLPGTDVLKFQDGKFQSRNFSKLGFQPTNYTITIPDVGPAFWETMQSGEKGQVTFWRGEWDGDTMSGMISRQFADGKNEDYYFTSSAKVKIPPTSEEEKEKEAAYETSSETLATDVPATTALVSGPRATGPTAEIKEEPKKTTAPKTDLAPSRAPVSPGEVAQAAEKKTPTKKGGSFLNYWLSGHKTNQSNQ